MKPSAPSGTDLKPGDHHYRAFVGPVDRYDLIAALQFNLMTMFLGLRDSHTLLDIGCGSLRSGRLFIPFLNKGNYYGIEPERWIVEEGIKNEVGQSLIEIKTPSFRYESDFSFEQFGQKFDFVMAQSVFSHCPKTSITDCLTKARDCLRDDQSIFVATFVPGDRDYEGEEWVYPDNVNYRTETIEEMIRDCGLWGCATEYYHPSQVWYCIGLPGATTRIRDVQRKIDVCAKYLFQADKITLRQRAKNLIKKALVR